MVPGKSQEWKSGLPPSILDSWSMSVTAAKANVFLSTMESSTLKYPGWTVPPHPALPFTVVLYVAVMFQRAVDES